MAGASRAAPRACATIGPTCLTGTQALRIRGHVQPALAGTPPPHVTAYRPGTLTFRMTTESNNGQVTADVRRSPDLSRPRWACSEVLTHKGGVPCKVGAGALVPRRSTTAGVPGPRRNADECDAGWFAPVATRRRPMFRAFKRPEHRAALPDPSRHTCACQPRPRSPDVPASIGTPVPAAPRRPLPARGNSLVDLSPPRSLCMSAPTGHASMPARGFPGALSDAWTRASGQSMARQSLRRARSGAYSVLRNSAMATASMPSPITATSPSDTPSGTTQPAHVTPGASACPAAGLMARWLNTARRIGSTM
jgi:hypothetical protein